MATLLASASEKENVNVVLRAQVEQASKTIEDARLTPVVASPELTEFHRQFQAQTAALQSSQRLVDQLSHQVATLNNAVNQLMTASVAPVAVVAEAVPAKLLLAAQ